MKKMRLLMFMLLVSFGTYAQGPGFEDDVVDEVPIDGGVSALVIAGAAYGVKKLKDARKANELNK